MEGWPTQAPPTHPPSVTEDPNMDVGEAIIANAISFQCREAVRNMPQNGIPANIPPFSKISWLSSSSSSSSSSSWTGTGMYSQTHTIINGRHNPHDAIESYSEFVGHTVRAFTLSNQKYKVEEAIIITTRRIVVVVVNVIEKSSPW